MNVLEIVREERPEIARLDEATRRQLRERLVGETVGVVAEPADEADVALPHRSGRDRRWWVSVAAVALVVALLAAVIALATRREAIAPAGPADPGRTSEAIDPSQTVADVEADPDVNETDVEADTGLSFTPLALTEPPDGFELIASRVGTGEGGGGIVTYAHPDHTTELDIWTRHFPNGEQQMIDLGRESWIVDGRTVYAEKDGDGRCLHDYCAIGFQWDEQTFATLQWVERAGGSLVDGSTRERLLELVPRLVENTSFELEPAPNTLPATSSPVLDDPGPEGAMALPTASGMSVEFAKEGSLAGDAPIRWYATRQAKPEAGPYLQLVSSEQWAPDGHPLGCMLAASATRDVTLKDGTPACLEVRDGSDPFGRIAIDRSPYLVVIEGRASDDELLTAATHVVPSTYGPGFEIADAGLPAGVALTGIGLGVSDFAATSLDGAEGPMVQVNWTDDEGRSMFYVATSGYFVDNLRLGYESVTDITVRGVPAFTRTLEGQPNYLGVVWHENDMTYQVGSQRLGEVELLDLIEQMRPATRAEWDAAIADSPDDDTMTSAVSTTTTGLAG